MTQEHEKQKGKSSCRCEYWWRLRRITRTWQTHIGWWHSQGNIAIQLVMDWLKRRKDDHQTLDQYLKHHVLDAEHRIYTACQKDFVLQCNLLYLRVTPKRSNEDVLVFVVPGLKRQTAITGCHQYLGHQGRDHTLSLLRERFWWPGMAQRMMMSIHNFEKCHIF